MPNRIIKDSICESEKLANLNDFEFRLWVGLITQADDAGRGDARPAIIKGRVFPLRERVTIKEITAALHALAAGSCVTLYEVDGRPYYQFPGWAKHQRIRDSKPKYPAPEDGKPIGIDDFAISPRAAASCGELPPKYNPIQSNTIQSESETNTRTRVSDGFEKFWIAYPKKVGKDAALKAWAKTKGVSIDIILQAVEAQKRSAQWQKDEGQYIPNPATWLNQGRWKDQVDKTSGYTSGGVRHLDEDEKAAIRRMMGGSE